MNIRARLTVLFAFLVASIMLLFSLLIYYRYNQSREQDFTVRLQDKALTTARLLDDVGGMTEQLLHRIDRNDASGLYNSHVTVFTTKGVLYASDNNPIVVSPALLAQAWKGKTFYIRRETAELIGFRYKTLKNEHRVIVASAADRHGFSKLERLRDILIIGWLGSLGVVILAGWIFAGDALKPVSGIIDQVNAISASNIHDRLRVRQPKDELAKLSDTFNAMLNRLEEAFVSQKNFVSHASHELRTPLTVMMGQVDVALMQPRSGAEYENTLEGVQEELKKMKNLVDGLLDLASANADAATASFLPVRIDELLGQTQSLLLQKNPGYQISIQYGTIPEQEEELMLLGEQSLLRTAFHNLMENGCKYSPDHQVDLTLHCEQGQIRLAVSDKGNGISAEDLPHIFQPFFRSSSTVGVEGHGIGLTLTRRIIELHRGQIQVESVIGRGTVFIVTLPTLQNHPAEPLLAYEVTA